MYTRVPVEVDRPGSGGRMIWRGSRVRPARHILSFLRAARQLRGRAEARHELTPMEALRGLSSSEAAAKLRQYGPNQGRLRGYYVLIRSVDPDQLQHATRHRADGPVRARDGYGVKPHGRDRRGRLADRDPGRRLRPALHRPGPPAVGPSTRARAGARPSRGAGDRGGAATAHGDSAGRRVDRSRARGHFPRGEAMRGPRGGRLGLGRATSRSQGRLTETRPPATAMRNARRFITHSRLAMSPRRDRARRPAGSTLLQPSHVRELPTAPARLFCRPCSRPVGLTSRVAQSPPTPARAVASRSPRGSAAFGWRIYDTSAGSSSEPKRRSTGAGTGKR